MSTFTTVVKNVPTLGVEAYDIHTVVKNVRRILLEGPTRTNNIKVSFGLLERGGRADNGGTFHHATVTLVNIRGRELDVAHVWGEQPMEARRQYHANDHSTSIKCRECGNDEFYNVDRSLDYENHICSECGAMAHTLTETGASA